MKKNMHHSHHQGGSTSINNSGLQTTPAQQQHYFQTAMVIPSSPGGSNNNYQSNSNYSSYYNNGATNQHHHLMQQQQQQQQQVYYTSSINKNNPINSHNVSNNNNNNNNNLQQIHRNTSRRLSHNGQQFIQDNKNHFNNNGNHSNNVPNGNYSHQQQMPQPPQPPPTQQFTPANNYHYTTQHQMQFSNETRRNSYQSASQQQQHHHQQQHQQQHQPVLTNLSNNQNYSKQQTNYNKPLLQKQISLPDQSHLAIDLSSQFHKNLHLNQINSSIVKKHSPSLSSADNNELADQLIAKPVCNFVNDLSPVYEANSINTNNGGINISDCNNTNSKNNNNKNIDNNELVKKLDQDEQDSKSQANHSVEYEITEEENGDMIHVIQDNYSVFDENIEADEEYKSNHSNEITNENNKETNLLTSSSSSESSLSLTPTTATATSTCTNTEVVVAKTLSDLVQKAENYKDKSEYFRHLVFAIDQLYPDCKWPLHCTWTFWFIKHDNNKTWSDNLKTIIDVSYVEDFWSTINYLLNIPNLINQGDLTFFKKGIKPMWEDEQNKSGGCWLFQLNNQQFKKVDDLWLETLLALIGDNFCDHHTIQHVDSSYFDKKSNKSNMSGNEKDNDHICEFLSGTILMHRGKNDKLSLWTKNYKDDLTTRLIGKLWKNVMKLNDSITINFEVIINIMDK